MNPEAPIEGAVVTDGMRVPAKLLLVDDRPENLAALKGILKHPGYQLFTATSGTEALKLVLRERFAVILLDVVMPEMDGFEVARHLKALERTRNIPILFLTAIATDVQHIYRAYEIGAVDYIVKPLDTEVVRRKVAVFVDLIRQREEIKRQAEALREAERREYELKLGELRFAGDRRYRKLVEGIDHVIGWTTDDTLRFSFVSQQAPRILGYPMQRFLEPSFWSDHLHPQDREAVLAMFHRAVAEAIELGADHRLIAEDGRAVWFHTAVSGDSTPDVPAELHGISIDISDLKRAEVEARHATHVREQLLAIVAHDLRNPLGSIRTSGELLARIAASTRDPRAEKTARTIIRSAERMDRLIRDLLDFALIEAERLKLEHEIVDAKDLLHESLEVFKPLADEKRIQLAGHAREALQLDGDRDRLLQILSNLIGNAIKFTPQGGSVALRIERSGDEAIFAITDTGPGISEDDVLRIWDRYWQVSRTHKGGVGLGLSIAKGLVEAHRGRIWAESKVGAGTTFSFTVPLAAPESTERAGGSEPEANPGEQPMRPS